ncbi:MAG TPA: hypothetical protein EYN38_11425 [Flavobacteriales bacterium]|nr:hypothetical protein [Flavobacteriales bacterium]HIA13281.1 hypothetical protein [Flavobacteriales bacterium]HIO73704.1 hypothetical protein [Flavobacteriales bacterium]
MVRSIIEIAEFRRDTSFYGTIDLLLTIKSFNLQAIRKRYIASLSNLSGRTGSVERREVSLGGMVRIRIDRGKLTVEEKLCTLKEPRGIDLKHGQLAISSENKVYLIGDTEVQSIENDWFSYIHTVKYHAGNPNKLLVSSSGFDAIFEYDLLDKSPCFEWFAWEHGFNKGVDPELGEELYLTRKAAEAIQYRESGLNHLFIQDPLKDVLPTAKRAAFINSVDYDVRNQDSIIATFFHLGAANRIEIPTGKPTPIIEDLQKPHGACNYKDGYMVTSTGAGSVVLSDAASEVEYSLRGLPCKPDELNDREWVQNAITFGNIILAIDSNRTAFVIFDIEKRIYDIVPYNTEWAVQDAVVGSVSANQIEGLKEISE